MSPINFKYCAMLIYRLQLSDMADGVHVTICCGTNWGGVGVFSQQKQMGGGIINTPLAPSVGLKGLYQNYAKF